MTAVTCVALARLKASIQKSSSMKLSLTGYSVPWTMKTSRPRTFSSTRTKTLPSLKTCVSDCASSIPRWLADRLRRASELALPAKTFSSPYGSVCFDDVVVTDQRLVHATVVASRSCSGVSATKRAGIPRIATRPAVDATARPERCHFIS